MAACTSAKNTRPAATAACWSSSWLPRVSTDGKLDHEAMEEAMDAPGSELSIAVLSKQLTGEVRDGVTRPDPLGAGPQPRRLPHGKLP